MLEPLPEWPAYGPDQTVQDSDDAVFYSAGLFQHDLTYITDAHQQLLSNSPKLVSAPCQHPTSEAQDEIAQWKYAPYMRPIVQRPTPRYPPGYGDHIIDYLPLVDDHPTPDRSELGPTPALTDSQSEPLRSPAMEDISTSIPEPLQHENISQQMQLPLEPQFSCFPISFSLETLEGEEYPLRSAQETRAQASVYYQPSSVHVAEYPKPVTHVVPLKFSRETYNALLQTRNPTPQETKVPSDKDPYSFTILSKRESHPVISISETGGELTDITIDLKKIITVLTSDNFCRMPGCGYWSKNAGRVPRHRLTHFKDRGFECQNPLRRGADVPKYLQCQLGPGQYLTRLDLFKKHCRSPSCREYAPSFIQDLQKNCWRGPDSVDELYLLPFTRDIHVPFVLKVPKPLRV